MPGAKAKTRKDWAAAHAHAPAQLPAFRILLLRTRSLRDQVVDYSVCIDKCPSAHLIQLLGALA